MMFKLRLDFLGTNLFHQTENLKHSQTRRSLMGVVSMHRSPPHRLAREEVAYCLIPFVVRLSYQKCENRSILGLLVTDGWLRRSYCNQNISEPDSGKLYTDFQSADTYPFLKSKCLQHWFKNWQERRKHRLTASTFAAAVGFRHGRRVQLWLEKIGAIETFSGNIPTFWSNVKEEEALERYKLITGNTVMFPEFQVYGNANKDPVDSWLGASPDGIVYGFPVDKDVYVLPAGGVLEIKCPFFRGDMANANPWLRIPIYYVPQAQGLMEILDRDWMDFYVWTPKGSSLFRMYRDEKYWNVLKMALSDFWWKHVQPAKKLCSKSVIMNPLTELHSLRPAARHELCSYIVYDSKRIVDSSKLLMREIDGKLQI
ncbi:uncharacterized protein LOC107419592 isoform X1 [Ziziphus jujuba]|uniref:Uncharacterized protein LOC107419592 isoform X1 n=2 Tax=Ziziphus jujuba TaxID=326968 RepID=A0A6P3ZUH2_ZIZJJ|nr:uncharacterized protein LOC107419592 isoform X1 [Ziziphus jujuba]KAH7529327.1 hypothetical protein FEM48_Zijuj05G0172600 [Ziziphus jujuba var. spinosa]